METCFYKKVKGVAENNNLHKIGVLVMHVKYNSATSVQNTFHIKVNDSVTLKANGGTFKVSADNYAVDHTEYTFAASSNAYQVRVQNADYDIEISNKYAITYLRRTTDSTPALFGVDLEEVGYIQNLGPLNLSRGGTYGDIYSLSTCENLTEISLSSTGISGDIAAISGLENLVSLDFNNTNVAGDIKDLGNLGNLTSFGLISTHVKGTIEGFIREFVTKNPSKVGVEISSYAVMGYFPFCGVYNTTGGSSIIVPYSASKGVVKFNDTTVYTMGFTQQEAEEEFPDKTIIRVDA